MAAQYLLRFDDIWPGMNWRVWDVIERALLASGTKPLLAVIPKNEDATLKFGETRTDFWSKVRQWQQQGWTIGMHGYEHRYVTRCAGLLDLNQYSEFAGLPYDVQRDKLQRGLRIFEREGVRPEVWIAPGHSFDEVTLQALHDVGFSAISDGLSLWPYQDRSGLLWVPQQMWRFRRTPFGLWTLCFHPNRWPLEQIDAFSRNLQVYSPRITSFSEVVEQYRNRTSSVTDAAFRRCASFLLGAKHHLQTRRQPSWQLN